MSSPSLNPGSGKKIHFNKSGPERRDERILSPIEGHLCFFIEQGRLDVNMLLPLEKQALIREKLKVIGNNSLRVIKKQMGNDFSYDEIRMVLALQNYQTQ
ncbi:MAG: hypothetical protein HN580_12165 [Deltaproteobacteria bacterium]|jgi:hypothetical protein|nr:hypothetical protein [Deltaproteobacteria bacterium]MBT4091702.1 hypothetical protein [Deltaproteobacteria bacterium]MBT4263263.1 hypothetical protein [Deltaproteobacteria bacterium]MBT4637889.1 hypothetical protein [Deltaproteobacteria bacterium]MBT6498438.1 hypothetical protein [Deltaproteobacteria bacterium]